MTPKPESETDPWADVEAAYADIAVNKTARVYLADVVESARAAEAAQHRQAIAAKDAHIKAVEGVLREHGEFGDLFQPGGRFHREANLLLGGSAVADGGRWLVARLAAVEAERDRLKAALQDVVYTIAGWRTGSIGSIGNVHVGSFDVEHLARLRAALTPQGQSTDGEEASR